MGGLFSILVTVIPPVVTDSRDVPGAEKGKYRRHGEQNNHKDQILVAPALHLVFGVIINVIVGIVSITVGNMFVCPGEVPAHMLIMFSQCFIISVLPMQTVSPQ